MQDLLAGRATSPGYRIALLSRLSTQALTRKLGHLGIGSGQIGVLMDVIGNEGIGQDELTLQQQTDRAATARALAALEDSGFVVRHENPENRRCKLAFPTAKARESAQELVSILNKHSASLFRSFSEQEKNTALALLDRMIANMQEEVFGPGSKQ
jgi:DNA-binding MarR family transcriptional regulator